jgi:hypothetical protein
LASPDRDAFLVAIANILRSEPQPLGDGQVARAIRGCNESSGSRRRRPSDHRRRGAQSGRPSSEPPRVPTRLVPFPLWRNPRRQSARRKASGR